MAEARNIYLDSNAIILFAEGAEDWLTPFFVRTLEAGARFFTSELTLAEVLVVPLREGSSTLAEAYDTFLRTDEALTVVPVDREVLRRSAKVRALFGGKTPDSIHVATAEMVGCSLVISSDERLRLPAGIVRVSVQDVGHIGEAR